MRPGLRWTCLGICLLAILFLSGCWVPSLNALFEDSDIVYDPGLEGLWVANDGSASITFTRDGQAKCYKVVYWEEGGSKFGPEHDETTKLYACLGRIGNSTFLDVTAGDDQNFTEALAAHLAATHTFWRIELGTDTLSMQTLKNEWFDEMAKKKKLGLAYVPQKDHILLTASTPVLKDFFKRNGSSREIYDEKQEFHRKK